MSYQVDVELTGVTGLLQHRFGPAAITESQAIKKQTGERDYSEEWRDTIFVDDGGNLYEPAYHIEGALFRAASSFKVKGKRGSTFKNLAKAAVYVEPDRIFYGIKVPEKPTSNPEEPFSVDLRPVVVSRARVLRARGMIGKGWKLAFVINVTDDQLSATALHEILSEAGRAHGLGDYRPRFGRFMVTKFETVAA